MSRVGLLHRAWMTVMMLLAWIGSANAEEQKVSIDVQEAPISGVLHQLAQYQSYNLIIDSHVTGNISVNLQQVSWQEAMDAVLTTSQLQAKTIGNTLYIAPQAHFIEMEQQQLSVYQTAQQRAPLLTEVINVHYADVAQLYETLNQGGTSLLSERGGLRFDVRTSSLIIRDRQDVIERMKVLIEQLDKPVEQVRIEARIVTVNEDNLDELGVRWGLSHRIGDLMLMPSTDAAYQGYSNEKGEPQIGQPHFNINFAVASDKAATLGFQLGNLDSDFLLDLELSALQSESKAEIIATPRLLTMDKQPAYIEQGTEIPYLVAASSGATSIEFKKAVLSLKVTPHITPDRQLILNLDMTQDTQGTVVKTGEGEAVAINTQKINTRVQVSNGETIVLGGIIQQLSNQGVDKVPLLADIPIIGHLFKMEYQQVRKQELLIFVTPKIVEL